MTLPTRFPPLLTFGAFPESIAHRLGQVFQLYDPDDLNVDPALHDRIEGIVTRSNYRIPQELLERLPNLGIIATNGVGYDGIPLAYTKSRGIVVTNTPDVLNKAVAELAIGLLLAILRHLPQADQFVRTGAWQTRPFPLGTTLAGKKIGMVGFGRIGKEIAKRFAPFDVDVAYFGRTQQQVEPVYFNDLKTLASYADVLIVCCPGGPDTYQIINADILRALGPAGVLVNISRGSVINEADLCKALGDGTILGAALDVFNEEPLADSPLRRLGNVVLAPHMGSATHETRMEMAELAIQNLTRYFTYGQAVTPVTG
ncbi:2-hydroxyacid dehydrogenase [Candidimonas sp. SYP-B2681]|uniref:2-hydroxyacid dehydrogenase n=1 Tax=Candidimonas sp. SYP-B2681 TaxID=2497686 RepID=UPI000F8623BC|nr:2-hydroxyacid dehydrogenase [Candidimonas sp. SYP-B2681]RTZ41594.1 2-hydroxyacid dehydrogenase [Candidimonas sp. SYP-B2681]